VRPRRRRPPGEELAARRRRAVLFGVLALLLLVVLLVVACGGDDPKPAAKPQPTAGQRIARTLSAEELVGQTIISPFRRAGAGAIPPALRTAIRRGRVGGVILFSENATTIADVRRLTRRLQALPRPAELRGVPLLVLTDQEGGQVRRITDAPPRASASAQGAAGLGAVARAGTESAAALCRAGVNVNLAPVADVGTGAIAQQDRTYADDVMTTARAVRSFVTASRRGGIATAAKHFPGLGRAQANTDDTRVRITAAAEALRAADELPFRAAIDAGTDLVMLSNAIYPAFGPTPAVLNPNLVTTELRRRLGFRGVTISDDLEAGAFAGAASQTGVARAAALAGVDLLLYGVTTDAALAASRALAADLGRKRLDLATVRASVARAIDLRVRLARTCRG
jgi:beta-N-acetylhexosaminidase